jgi:hypothetical protein
VSKATERLLRASPAGGEDSFDEFYRREYRRATRLAWLLTGSEAAAENVVQDAMAAVYRRFGQLESAGGGRAAVVSPAGRDRRVSGGTESDRGQATGTAAPSWA